MYFYVSGQVFPFFICNSLSSLVTSFLCTSQSNLSNNFVFILRAVLSIGLFYVSFFNFFISFLQCLSTFVLFFTSIYLSHSRVFLFISLFLSFLFFSFFHPVALPVTRRPKSSFYVFATLLSLCSFTKGKFSKNILKTLKLKTM